MIRYWKQGLGLLIVILLLLGCYLSYRTYLSPTRIAFINYSSFHLARIQKANDSRWIKIIALAEEDVEQNLDGFDAVFVFGRGLKLNPEQLETIRKAAKEGMPVFGELMNPDQEVTSLKGEHLDKVSAYLRNGGGKNFTNFLHYTRTVLDGKNWPALSVAAPVLISKDVLFHLDDEQVFEQVADYEQYLRKKGFFKAGGAKIVLLTSVPGPFNANRDHLDAMIEAFEDKGWNVYPIASTAKRLRFLQEINPDLVVELPHGRLSAGNADAAVAWLRKRNIPMLSPLSIFNLYDDWKRDPQGMQGGLLTMSVVLPEIDGGIAPYTIAAQFKDESGFAMYQVIPDRLEKFCVLIEKWLALRKKKNKDKKIAIYYFKGPGLNSLVASNLEVVPALYNTLKTLKEAGYTVENLPDNAQELEQRLQLDGAVLKPYAEGTLSRFFKEGKPALVSVDSFDRWAKKDLTDSMRLAMEGAYGKAPGAYMAVSQEDREYIGVARIAFGNVVLLPQPLPGIGKDTFKLIHGAKTAPPYPYIASYLWARHAFGADALIHFGTHGSLEFTPGKQVGLGNDDWSDALIANIPHFYIYTMSNVGEAIIAKRRSYATILSHLTAPFMQSGTYNELAKLESELHRWNELDNPLLREEYGKSISHLAEKLGFYNDLQADTLQTLSEKQLKKLADLVEEIDNAKVMEGLYTLGKPYTESQINQTVRLMCIDPISYGLASMDIAKGLVKPEILDDKLLFNKRYRTKAKQIVDQRLMSLDTTLTSVLPLADIERAKNWLNRQEVAEGRRERTNAPRAVDQKEAVFAQAYLSLAQALTHIGQYKQALRESTEAELVAIENALNGGYTAPSVGGDPVASPMALPTGRNMYSIDAEKTPTTQGWQLGLSLAEKTLQVFRNTHHGNYPTKVALTFWAGDFIQTDGAMLAQAFYLLGVEPVRDMMGKVIDVRLIPSDQLKRPRIDVVVQTSGQFRDLAASRIALLNKAVYIASQAKDKIQRNFVAEGILTSERLLKEKGFSPREAKELATLRVFGGIDGNYGSGIMGMVERSDRYGSSDEIADTYIHNMGAVYGADNKWSIFKEGLFETALQHTEMVLQPRQANTWGPLSLDHIYEFAGGLNNAVRKVTGKEPDVLFSDLRNPQYARVQSMKEAIWVESRSTILNPKFVMKMLKGGSSSAETFAETFRNTFGWNVMKSDVIDNELWNQLHAVYVDDKLNLGIADFFKRQNPYALEEMSAVLLEAHRKGFWSANAAQLRATAALHIELAKEYGAACSEFVCGNKALHKEIAQYLNGDEQKAYNQAIDQAAKINRGSKEQTQVRLKKEPEDREELLKEKTPQRGEGISWLWPITIAILIALGLIVRRYRRRTR